MKVLLINSPIRLDAKPSCIPYGLATIASTLRHSGFDVEIYDINGLRPSRNEIINDLQNRTWDIVGLSGLITTYKFQKWLFPKLKTINPNGVVVSGGGLATTSSQFLFDRANVDITVLGEGEQTMLELCQTLMKGKNLMDVAGIWFRENGHIVKNAPQKNIENLDSIPFPAWDLLPMDIYLKNPIWGDVANNSSGFKRDIKITRSMNIISTRGCPFSCRYCYHLFGQSNYRYRSVENVVNEVEVLIEQYHVDFIGFVDDNMMASEKWIMSFCDLMERKRIKVAWGCHGRVTKATPKVLERMSEVGCVWIGYGIESGSQKILDKMSKKVRIGESKKAIKNTRKVGIYPNTTFIFGYPGEDLETIQETINFKRELNIQCGSFFATPYPGTVLYKQVRSKIEDEEAFINKLGNATEFSINLTDFDDETLFCLKKSMDANESVAEVFHGN